MATDQYGYFGPSYSIADNIPMPNEIGVRQESSISAIIDSVGAVNTYVDIIAFGGPTFMDSHSPQPLGIRYFLNTDMRCSNGATMSEYVDGVTKGNIMGSHVEKALAGAGLPGLKGLAPGILENARDALDPRPILSAATGTGYPVCQKVACPVGDIQGAVTNKGTGEAYLVDPVQYGEDGIPRQTRWVQAYDATGSAIQVSQAEFAGAAKCFNADGSWNTRAPGCPSGPPADLTGGMTGSGPYASCRLLQGPTLPPTLEGFMDFFSFSSSFFSSSSSSSFFSVIVGLLMVLGVFWNFKRSKDRVLVLSAVLLVFLFSV
jgi:hypothetical protein